MNDAGMFVTVLYGVVDHMTREFAYARAGHELPLLINECGGVETVSRGQGQPLGILPDPDLDQQVVMIPRNGTLLLYTDGVTDAEDVDAACFGLDRLREALRVEHRSSARALCDRLLHMVMAYAGTAPQADDITLVAVQARL